MELKNGQRVKNRNLPDCGARFVGKHPFGQNGNSYVVVAYESGDVEIWALDSVVIVGE